MENDYTNLSAGEKKMLDQMRKRSTDQTATLEDIREGMSAEDKQRVCAAIAKGLQNEY